MSEADDDEYFRTLKETEKMLCSDEHIPAIPIIHPFNAAEKAPEIPIIHPFIPAAKADAAPPAKTRRLSPQPQPKASIAQSPVAMSMYRAVMGIKTPPVMLPTAKAHVDMAEFPPPPPPSVMLPKAEAHVDIAKVSPPPPPSVMLPKAKVPHLPPPPVAKMAKVPPPPAAIRPAPEQERSASSTGDNRSAHESSGEADNRHRDSTMEISTTTNNEIYFV